MTEVKCEECTMSALYQKTYRGYLVDHHTPEHPGVGFEKLDAALSQFTVWGTEADAVHRGAEA